jgi:hypothetical protein
VSEIIKTDGKTNSEIFEEYKRSKGTTRPFLTAYQKQVGYLMSIELAPRPCPNCGEPHNVPEAAGLSIDEFDFGNRTADRMGPCRKCARTLIFTLPMLGGDWHWRLDTAEAEAAAERAIQYTEAEARRKAEEK